MAGFDLITGGRFWVIADTRETSSVMARHSDPRRICERRATEGDIRFASWRALDGMTMRGVPRLNDEKERDVANHLFGPGRQINVDGRVACASTDRPGNVELSRAEHRGICACDGDFPVPSTCSRQDDGRSGNTRKR